MAIKKKNESFETDTETEGDSHREESEDDSLFVYSVKSSCVAKDEQFYEVWKQSSHASTVVKHHHTPISYVGQAENGRKHRRNRQHLRVCPALRHGDVNAELPSSADQTVVQGKEPPRDAEPDQARVPIMLRISHTRSKTYTRNQQRRTLRVHMSLEEEEK